MPVLAPVFLDSWSGVAASTDIETALAGALSTAAAAWPALSLSPHRFVAHLASCVSGEPDAPVALAKLHIADLYLACACLEESAPALAAFERLCLVDLGVVARVAPSGRSAAFVDEVRQRVRVHLFVGEQPKIAEYAGRGPLKGWVRVVALRLAQMMVRSTKRELLDEELGAAAALATSDPELRIIKDRYREVFADIVKRAVRGLEERERTVLRLHAIDGLNIEKIGVLYDVHRATVATWIAQARKAILAATRREMTQRLGLQPAELESLMGLVVSQLDVNLQSLLAPR